jgi:hypothetical protein
MVIVIGSCNEEYCVSEEEEWMRRKKSYKRKLTEKYSSHIVSELIYLTTGDTKNIIKWKRAQKTREKKKQKWRNRSKF